MSAANTVAKSFRDLHVAGNPIVLTNIYDVPSARAVAHLPTAKAIATASYAVANAAGIADDNMTYETNINAVRAIAPVVQEANKPLTVDWQDGYGDRLEAGIKELISLSVSGINLEDYDKENRKMYSIDQAADRVRRALATANACDVPDFVVNARTDTLLHGGPLADAIARGKAYLAAGATTVFVWGGSKRGGITKDEVLQLVDALNGMINVKLETAEGNLTVKDLKEIGVARISLGPALQFVAMDALTKEAERLLASG